MTVILYVYGIYCNIGNNLVTIHCMWLYNSVMYHYTFPPIKNVIMNAPRARVSPKYKIAVAVATTIYHEYELDDDDKLWF